MSEGSLAAIRVHYSIPEEYALHALLPGQRSNKGWKTRYLFVSGPRWGFQLEWSARTVSNVPPYLSEEESALIVRLKEILSSSQAIWDMIELLLAEGGPQPSPSGKHIASLSSFF
ncbi:hypothetical protein BHE74_00052802 [Ensete ventricosum]|nr:hypothetical protein BHE74_00052802 [Ensete ventricosum]